MKTLTKKQIQELVRQVGATREREMDCTECQSCFGEFAERQLAGLPVDEALALVQQHLTLCPECKEEFEALEKILRASD